VKPTKDGVNRALAATKLRGQTVTIDGQNVTIVDKTLPPSPTETVASALAKYAGVKVGDVSINTVGPTWGHEVSQKAIKALIYFFILLAIYLSIRFELKMAASAIVAVIHDIIFTVGVYALFHFPVTPATITAFLTILGFSLYDTVVVFDKVRENQRTLTATGRSTYGAMVNRSLNQVLMRSLSTSLVALLPVMSLLIVGTGVFGATSLEDFALALAAGLFIGSYSSIFVAAPLLAWWKEREPQYRALAQRRARVGGPVLAGAGAGAVATPIPAAAAATAVTAVSEPSASHEGEAEPATVGSKPTTPLGRTIQPRARQQRGRKRK
jgi:preprotein translocase subunit SecF